MKSRVTFGIAIAAVSMLLELSAQHIQSWAARRKMRALQVVGVTLHALTGAFELTAYQYAPTAIVVAVGALSLVVNLTTENGLTLRRAGTTLVLVAAAMVGVFLGTTDGDDDEDETPTRSFVPVSALIMLGCTAVCYALVIHRARGLPVTHRKQKSVCYGVAIALGLTASSWAGTSIGNLFTSSTWRVGEHWSTTCFLVFVNVVTYLAQQFGYFFVYDEGLDMHLCLCAVEAFAVAFSYVPTLVVLKQMRDVTWPNWGGIAAAQAVQIAAVAAMAAE